jgi:phosphotransferase system enzyme I (PtsI)
MILEDANLKKEVERRIREQRKNVEFIFHQVFEENIQKLQNIEDTYLRERTVDLIDVRDKVISYLYNKPKMSALNTIEVPGIVVAHDIMPSGVTVVNPKKVLGFITEVGGLTTHTSIVARGLKIPAIVGMKGILSILDNEDYLILDGIKGDIIINPREETKTIYRNARNAYDESVINLMEYKDLDAVTTDGHKFALSANMEIPEELPLIISYGAEGVGLFRSEFLYMREDDFPSEEEQFEAYKEVVEKMSPSPVVIRTLDIGGDKYSKYFNIEKEANPFLGWRSIRFCLSNADIFKVQLRAILRASAIGKVRIMFPMITGLGQLKQVLNILEEVKEAMRKEGIEFDRDIEVGIMIETPAAAVVASSLAKYVDFFSIGTNDLIQYALAVDRGNEKISHLFDPYHPGVLKLIKLSVDAAIKSKIHIAMCGEMAGIPYFTPFLIGIGIKEFSMIASSIPEVKKIIRSISLKEAQKIAKKVLKMEEALHVKSFLKNIIIDKFPDMKNL